MLSPKLVLSKTKKIFQRFHLSPFFLFLSLYINNKRSNLAVIIISPFNIINHQEPLYDIVICLIMYCYLLYILHLLHLLHYVCISHLVFVFVLFYFCILYLYSIIIAGHRVWWSARLVVLSIMCTSNYIPICQPQ